MNNNGSPVLVVVVLVAVWVTGVVGISVGVLIGMFKFVFPLIECPVWELAVV